MNFRSIPLAISLSISATLFAVEPASHRTAAERIAARSFPSVFQAWNPADNIKNEDRATTLARHDLIFHAPEFFGLRWSGEFQGLSTIFTSASQTSAVQFRNMLLGKNPTLVTLAELRYRDAPGSYLPENHPWWQRSDGKPVAGWAEGGYFVLDYPNAAYQAQVARQAKAIMDSGVFDGIMLDWWLDDDDRLALVKAIRRQIGETALILVNANDRKTPRTAAFVNGYFMECYKSRTAEDWNKIAETLACAERNLKEPRINCVETWFDKSRSRDLNRMRATTALTLTLSNGYCLFSDPNDLPTADHLHDWYDFWNKSLGRPRAPGGPSRDGSFRREFEQGLVVYNPLGNTPVTVEFTTLHTSASTKTTARNFSVPTGDGELFLNETQK